MRAKKFLEITAYVRNRANSGNLKHMCVIVWYFTFTTTTSNGMCVLIIITQFHHLKWNRSESRKYLFSAAPILSRANCMSSMIDCSARNETLEKCRNNNNHLLVSKKKECQQAMARTENARNAASMCLKTLMFINRCFIAIS